MEVCYLSSAKGFPYDEPNKVRGLKRVDRSVAILAAMVLVTMGCTPQEMKESPGVTPLSESKPASLGQTLFEANCAACHGMSGHGNAAMFSGKQVHFNDKNWQALTTDAHIRDVIQHGQGMMPDFGDTFSEAELQALLQYIRSLESSS